MGQNVLYLAAESKHVKSAGLGHQHHRLGLAKLYFKSSSGGTINSDLQLWSSGGAWLNPSGKLSNQLRGHPGLDQE